MNIEHALQFIRADQGLTENQKEELLGEEGRSKLAKLISGAGGASLGIALAKYKNMGKIAQTVLGTLGFGAGVLIYKYYTRERFTEYNDKSKMYEIK